jgi:hypothetical protein
VSARFDQPDLTGQQRPINFALRAEATLADGTRCVVGGMPLPSAGNAMTQTLATVLLVGKDGTILWNRTLSIPGDIQGSRATHCTAGLNGSLYLLVETELASPYGRPIWADRW